MCFQYILDYLLNYVEEFTYDDLQIIFFKSS